MRTIVAAVAVVVFVGCGAQTPQQEAGSFLEDMARCLEQNRADIIAAMDSGDDGSIMDDMCCLTELRSSLSPAALSLVEEHGSAAWLALDEEMFEEMLAEALSPTGRPVPGELDQAIEALSDAAESVRNAPVATEP